MKGNNSILPPGANFEGARRGRSNMRMAVVAVVMLHVVLFTGIPFQACKQKEDDGGDADENKASFPRLKRWRKSSGNNLRCRRCRPLATLHRPAPCRPRRHRLPPKLAAPANRWRHALPPLPPNGGASSAAPTPAPTPAV